MKSTAYIFLLLCFLPQYKYRQDGFNMANLDSKFLPDKCGNNKQTGKRSYTLLEIMSSRVEGRATSYSNTFQFARTKKSKVKCL